MPAPPTTTTSQKPSQGSPQLIGRFIDLVFFTVYRFAFMPLAVTAIFFLGFPFIKKVRQGVKMRLPINGKTPWMNFAKNQRPLWIHCASGEFEYAKPIIRKLKKQAPNIPILVTYFTPSYAKAIHSFADVDMACPLPWDFPGPLRQFIRHHQPRALLFARTDLWPEVLKQCRRAKVPTCLFSATRSTESLGQKIMRPAKKWLYQQLDQIFCVSKEDAANFNSLKLNTPIKVFGDTRYDQVSYRIKNANPIKDSLFSTSDHSLTLVAGSTWSEDEDVLLPSIMKYIKSGALNLVLVPHEPTETHIRQLQKRISSLDLKSILYTEAKEWSSNSILIVNRTGILAELYTHGDLAFVGGSFHGSVHSVMEPLAAGCLTFVGPYYKNNREAIEFSTVKVGPGYNFNAVNPLKSASDFENSVGGLLELKEQLSHWRAAIQFAVQKKEGASQKVLDWIHPYI